MAVLGAQQHELPPPPPSPHPSVYKRDGASFALLSSDAGKCQLSVLLMSQGPWSSSLEPMTCYLLSRHKMSLWALQKST